MSLLHVFGKVLQEDDGPHAISAKLIGDGQNDVLVAASKRVAAADARDHHAAIAMRGGVAGDAMMMGGGFQMVIRIVTRWSKHMRVLSEVLSSPIITRSCLWARLAAFQCSVIVPWLMTGLWNSDLYVKVL